MKFLNILVFAFHISLIYGILFDKNNDHVVVDKPEIVTSEHGLNFPKKFDLKFGQNLGGNFEEIPNQRLPEVTVLQNGQHIKVLDQSHDDLKVYSEVNGRGFATLSKNKRDSNNKYQVMARIFDKSEHYDLVHDSQSRHLLSKRNADPADTIKFDGDYIVPDEFKNMLPK